MGRAFQPFGGSDETTPKQKVMEIKTQVIAKENEQELFIHREFDLPVHLLFMAYTNQDILEQWMGTKVLELNNEAFSSYHFETTDPMGNIHPFRGCIHQIKPNEIIVRTFEMIGTAFPPQMEYLNFISLGENKSKLEMQVVYKSVFHRDEHLKMPFAQGINWAHNRLEEIVKSNQN